MSFLLGRNYGPGIVCQKISLAARINLYQSHTIFGENTKEPRYYQRVAINRVIEAIG